MAARVSMNQRALGHAFNIQDPPARKSLEKNTNSRKNFRGPFPAASSAVIRSREVADAAGRGVPTASCGLWGELALTVRHGPFGWAQVIKTVELYGIFIPRNRQLSP